MFQGLDPDLRSFLLHFDQPVATKGQCQTNNSHDNVRSYFALALGIGYIFYKNTKSVHRRYELPNKLRRKLGLHLRIIVFSREECPNCRNNQRQSYRDSNNAQNHLDHTFSFIPTCRGVTCAAAVSPRQRLRRGCTSLTV